MLANAAEADFDCQKIVTFLRCGYREGISGIKWFSPTDLADFAPTSSKV
jgi:hypothetical protein